MQVIHGERFTDPKLSPRLSIIAFQTPPDVDITHKNASDNMCICINFVFVVKNMLAPKTNVFVITNVFASMSCLSSKLVYLR